MKAGFTLGVFDCFHVGHLNLLKRAKEECDLLLVGVVSDEAVKAQKGADRPVVPFEERLRIVQAISYVSNAYYSATFNPKDIVDYIIKDLCVGLTTIFKGEDQAHVNYNDILQKYPYLIIRTFERTPNISTTERINKLK